MPESDWETIQIKEIRGKKKKVAEGQKNATIEKGMNTWDYMGLSDEQKAFGAAVIGTESAFDPHAKGLSKSEHGLGQFNDDTWKEAVKYYNDKQKEAPKSRWPVVDPVKGRDDYDSQIRSWVRGSKKPGRVPGISPVTRT